MFRAPFALLALTIAGVGCGSATNSEDRRVCAESVECEDECLAFARAEETVQSFVCVGERCSCGIAANDSCFATGGVIGREEVTCPANADAVMAAAETALTNQ
jgi:hypothetical protein